MNLTKFRPEIKFKIQPNSERSILVKKGINKTRPEKRYRQQKRGIGKETERNGTKHALSALDVNF